MNRIKKLTMKAQNKLKKLKIDANIFRLEFDQSCRVEPFMKVTKTTIHSVTLIKVPIITYNLLKNQYVIILYVRLNCSLKNR